MKLTICNNLKAMVPDFNISAYTFDLDEINDPNQLSKKITNAFLDLKNHYQNLYTLDMVTSQKTIKQTRDGYKKLGKDPSHTRPACEALFRRILKDGYIYRLGNVIDFGNLLSLQLLKSVCVVDASKLQGDINIRIGTKDDEYYGINRGKINVDRLPLYTDEISPFGNPTSDTIRTAVTNQTKSIFLMVIHFSNDSIKEDEQMIEQMIHYYLKVKNLKKIHLGD